MSEKGYAKRTRVSNASDSDEEPNMFIKPKTLQMIFQYDISIGNPMNDSKKKSPENVSTYGIEHYVHDTAEHKNYALNPFEKKGDDEDVVKEHHVEPYFESHSNFPC